MLSTHSQPTPQHERGACSENSAEPRDRARCTQQRRAKLGVAVLRKVEVIQRARRAWTVGTNAILGATGERQDSRMEELTKRSVVGIHLTKEVTLPFEIRAAQTIQCALQPQ